MLFLTPRNGKMVRSPRFSADCTHPVNRRFPKIGLPTAVIEISTIDAKHILPGIVDTVHMTLESLC
jgi:hypothetical protein